MGDYYTARVRAVQNGTWKSGNVWGGVKEGMIRVGDFGSRCRRPCSRRCWRARRTLPRQAAPFHAAQGHRARQRGHEVIAKGQTLSDAQILGMNWLVEGVQNKTTR